MIHWRKPDMATEQTFTFPLSFGQQRLWFHQQLEPKLPLYNIPVAYRLNGKLDIPILERSLNEIIRRHEAFRTTFMMEDEQPVQVVHAILTVKLPVIDLQMLPQLVRESEVSRLLKEEAQQPFDLTHGPLLRFQVLRLGPEEHVFLFTVHHIIFDDWSMGIFCQELQALYTAHKEEKPCTLPELPIQYADYAVWQREWEMKIFEKQLVYWEQQLKDAPTFLELPTDRPRPSVQTHHGNTFSFTFSRDMLQMLHGFSRKENVTPFMLLLSAFQALLARYTAQNDIVVGSPVINRNRIEVEPLIGFFVNTLVMRTDLSGTPTFRELLRRVRKVALDAYTYDNLPFEKLIDALQLERDLSYSPIFQVMFALHNVSSSTLKLSGLSVSQLETNSGTAKFDLSLTIATGDELVGVLEYNTDLFNRETMVRMAEHFQILLKGAITHPDLPLDDLPVLTAEERQQLLVKWNETATGYPDNACMHQLFEAQVEKCPDAIAIVFEGQTLTYRVLNQRVNQLAHHLQSLGVGPEVVVGICVKRSLEMVIGLLGILKAGGVYLPLDPSYPEERLAFMLEDTQAPILLTQQQLIQELPELRANVICLDTDWEMIALESAANPQSGTLAQNLAYIIYTSGSTGKPKGVMISHEALINFLLSMREKLAITKQDVMLATTSLSFDIAGLELYLPLLVGSQIVIASQEIVADGKQLAKMIDLYGSSIMQMTPSAWRMLEETGWPGNRKLRILCGGEALTLQLAHTLLMRGGCLVNLYGPTETTIWSTLHNVEPTDSALPGAISLGRPIANTQVYVLDAAMQPVAIGIAGELYIGGTGLARGYFNRSELTAERFVPHPFSEKPGARLYRTGDLVRYSSSGNLEFLGRIDHQVKVRGFRIELGEIESVLLRHQDVRDAIVLVREDAPGDKRLVAYLIADQKIIPSINSLRDYLSTRLPGYMVPSTLMFVDTFPLTPNGKVDRKRLPVPDQSRPELDRVYVAPRRPIEELLADIWAQVLGIEQVGIHDNLFDLGGDSIHSVQITTRAQRVGLLVTPRQLLQHRTIDRLVCDLMAHPSSREQVQKIESFLQTLSIS
jgi:amino acid adenylation domain-containing protein